MSGWRSLLAVFFILFFFYKTIVTAKYLHILKSDSHFSAYLETKLFLSEKVKRGVFNISLLTENSSFKQKQFMHSVYLL